jgi:hypothetical protein
VKVYIDDFGTGYSSLSYLANLPVYALKIDRDFVSRLGDERNSSIVRSVISLAHNLGLQVIAEGVETSDQLDYLKALKCQFGQGYLFSRPCDSDQATEILRKMSGAEYEKKVKLANLRAFELFEGLDDDTVGEVASICEELTVAAGCVVIREGQAGDKIYLMQEGTVGIYRGESDTPRYLAVPRAPTVFGEMAILSQGHLRTANVKALSPLRLLAIPIPSFDPLVRRLPRLKENLLNLVSERTVG